MKMFSKTSTKILHALTEGIDEEARTSMTFDRMPGTYMAVHIERVGTLKDGGELYSVAHYFKQNGDLIQDPDMVFMKCSTSHMMGVWIPISIQHPFGPVVYATKLGRGEIEGYYSKEFNDQVSFGNTFLRNIKHQQDIAL